MSTEGLSAWTRVMNALKRLFTLSIGAVCIGASLVGCSDGSSQAFGLTSPEIAGTWSLENDELNAVFTLNADGTLTGENWPAPVLCLLQLEPLVPLMVGSWDSSDIDASIYLSLDDPCGVSTKGYLQRVDDGLEIWFYEEGADLEGFPEPEWQFRKNESEVQH